MKKAIVALFVLLTIFATTAVAGEDPTIDPKILSAFQKEFSFAQNVTWQKRGELMQVNFSLYDHGFVAWYNANAELVSTARNILYMQLPLSVIKILQHDYPDGSFLNVVEITSDNETFYQIWVEVRNKKLLLKATPYGTISVIKKFK